jgi:hypothetical protein
MSAYIKPEHLAFLEECKSIFSKNGRRETHQNIEGTLIALRYGEDRDCIKIIETGEEIAFFAQQIDPCPSFRKEVSDFARDMETQLKENDHKGGWEDGHHQDLSGGILYNHEKLRKELIKIDKDKYQITIRCANIANFSLMIADNEGQHL